jgi:hypothetical protein
MKLKNNFSVSEIFLYYYGFVHNSIDKFVSSSVFIELWIRLDNRNIRTTIILKLNEIKKRNSFFELEK